MIAFPPGDVTPCFSSTGCWNPDHREGPEMKRSRFTEDRIIGVTRAGSSISRPLRISTLPTSASKTTVVTTNSVKTPQSAPSLRNDTQVASGVRIIAECDG